jgi:lipopolysaccharide export system protein LptA
VKRVALFATAALFAAAPAAHGVDTTISGGRMELVNKGDEALFTGGVTLERGADTLLSREMRTNRARDKINVKGNIRMTRHVSSTETWKAFGDTGFYSTKDGAGYLIGTAKRAHVTRTEIVSSTETRVMDIFADRIDFVREGQRTFAQGNVYGKTIDPKTGDVMEFHSQEAEHLGDEGRVTLTGKTEKPVLTQAGVKGTKRVTGKTIIYYIDTRRLVSKDSAEAVMRQKHQEK